MHKLLEDTYDRIFDEVASESGYSPTSKEFGVTKPEFETDKDPYFSLTKEAIEILRSRSNSFSKRRPSTSDTSTTGPPL